MRRRPRHLRAPHRPEAMQGFTLIEVAFSLSVLALLAISVVASLGTSLRVDNANRRREVARMTARSQLETVLAWPDYSTLRTTFDGLAFEVEGLTPGAAAPFGAPGSVAVDDTNPDLARASVQVVWETSYGDETLEMSVLISNPEMTIVPE